MSAYHPKTDDTRQFHSVAEETREVSRPDGVSPEAAPTGSAVRAPRKAQLRLSRIEPWSVMRFSFILSLVCFIVLFIAVAVLYAVLAALGVFDAVSAVIADLTATEADGGVDAASWFSATRILGYAALIGAVDVVLITALATISAVMYNLTADLVGGIQVTLSENE